MKKKKKKSDYTMRVGVPSKSYAVFSPFLEYSARMVRSIQQLQQIVRVFRKFCIYLFSCLFRRYQRISCLFRAIWEIRYICIHSGYSLYWWSVRTVPSHTWLHHAQTKNYNDCLSIVFSWNSCWVTGLFSQKPFPPGTIRTNGYFLLGRFTRDDSHKW